MPKKVQFDLDTVQVQEIEPKEADIYGFRRDIEEIEQRQREINRLMEVLKEKAPREDESTVFKYQDVVEQEELLETKILQVENKAVKIIHQILEREMSDLMVKNIKRSFTLPNAQASEISNQDRLRKIPGYRQETLIKEMLKLLIRKNRMVLESRKQIQLEFMKSYWKGWMEEYTLLYDQVEAQKAHKEQ